MKHLFVFLIRLYQWTLAPFVGGGCRFYPSCSDYAIEALQKKGFMKGFWMILKRLLRCHPWHPGGHDPVP